MTNLFFKTQFSFDEHKHKSTKYLLHILFIFDIHIKSEILLKKDGKWIR